LPHLMHCHIALPYCTAISTLRLAIIPANMVRRDIFPPVRTICVYQEYSVGCMERKRVVRGGYLGDYHEAVNTVASLAVRVLQFCGLLLQLPQQGETL